MFITFGEKLFGVVDRVPGHFYVATPFLHICEFPLVPGRSYLVLYGSQVDPSIFRKGSFAGYSIYWSLKSIAMAWFRGLLGLLSVIAVITAGITYLAYFNDNRDPQNLHIGLAASGALLVFLGAYLISLRFTMANRQRLVAIARRLERKYPKAALVVQEYLKASGQNSLTAENDLD
jgi:hypothetical protein